MGLTKQYFSILRDVMVANAHQEQEPEGKRVFDIGYLVGVVGLLVVMISSQLHISKFCVSFCSRKFWRQNYNFQICKSFKLLSYYAPSQSEM